jgi:hypothetical protein
MLNATSTCLPISSGTIENGFECQVVYGVNSSTDPSYAGGFSYGEIVISTILFLGLLCLITITYHLHFRKIRIKNT